MQQWQKTYLKFVGATVLNVGVFVSYRLYMHFLKHKIQILQLEQLRPLSMYPVKILDFTNQAKLLKSLNFVTTHDDLDEMQIAVFKYRDVFFSIYRHRGNPENNYTVNVDLGGYINTQQLPQELARDFIKHLKLNKLPVIWTNDGLNRIFADTSKTLINNPITKKWLMENNP